MVFEHHDRTPYECARVLAGSISSAYGRRYEAKLLLIKSDINSCVWIIMFLLGVAILLPWNVFITETHFFNARVHIPPYLPTLANNFESLFATVYQISGFITLSLFVLHQKSATFLHFFCFFPAHTKSCLAWPQMGQGGSFSG